MIYPVMWIVIGAMAVAALGILANWIVQSFPQPAKLKPWHIWSIVSAIIVASGVAAAVVDLSEQSESGSAAAPSPDIVSTAPTARPRETAPPSKIPSEDSENIQKPCSKPGPRPVDLPRKAEYVLKESNTPLTNANDKVDLDTGEPGHGSMPQGAWNPDRGGRLADLIVERDEIHTACRIPQIYLMKQRDTVMGVKACRRALKSETLSTSVRLEVLAEGSVICVRTDEGLVARVEIQYLKTTYPTTLTIGTIVDEP
jgi:hypothetical protein